jgi:hypothetical protein
MLSSCTRSYHILCKFCFVFQLGCRGESGHEKRLLFLELATLLPDYARFRMILYCRAPRDVLAAARKVIQQGGWLIVMDGDYSSLTYALHDPDNIFPVGFGARIDTHLRDAVFAQPNVMRQLPLLLPQTGWALEGAMTQAKVVYEVGAEPSYWVSFAKAYLPRMKESGMFHDVGGDSMVDKWWKAQEEQISRGSFFAHCIYYTMFAKAV